MPEMIFHLWVRRVIAMYFVSALGSHSLLYGQPYCFIYRAENVNSGLQILFHAVFINHLLKDVRLNLKVITKEKKSVYELNIMNSALNKTQLIKHTVGTCAQLFAFTRRH
jgi:hypothetical protein